MSPAITIKSVPEPTLTEQVRATHPARRQLRFARNSGKRGGRHRLGHVTRASASRFCSGVRPRRSSSGDPEAKAHVSALRAAAMAAARCSLLVVIFVGSIKGELLQRFPNPSEARRDRSKPSGALQKFLDCGSSRCPGAAPALKCGDPGIPSRRQKSASSRFIIGC